MQDRTHEHDETRRKPSTAKLLTDDVRKPTSGKKTGGNLPPYGQRRAPQTQSVAPKPAPEVYHTPDPQQSPVPPTKDKPAPKDATPPNTDAPPSKKEPPRHPVQTTQTTPKSPAPPTKPHEEDDPRRVDRPKDRKQPEDDRDATLRDYADLKKRQQDEKKPGDNDPGKGKDDGEKPPRVPVGCSYPTYSLEGIVGASKPGFPIVRFLISMYPVEAAWKAITGYDFDSKHVGRWQGAKELAFEVVISWLSGAAQKLLVSGVKAGVKAGIKAGKRGGKKLKVIVKAKPGTPIEEVVEKALNKSGKIPPGSKPRITKSKSTPPSRSSRAQRREVMRRLGVPTSQQPIHQSSPRGKGNKPAGRELIYNTPKGKVHLQHQLQDRNHGPHWEGGKTKSEQVDPAGRSRLFNDKVKVDK